MSKFQRDLEEAKKGEQKVRQLLEDKGWIVQDVSDEKEYQQQDIDFIITKDGRTHTIEVKYDGLIAATGNFFLELQSSMEYKTPGWFSICQADMVFYVDKQNNVVHIFSMKDMKEFVEKVWCRLVHTNADHANKTTQGRLASKEKFKQEYGLTSYELGGCEQ